MQHNQFASHIKNIAPFDKLCLHSYNKHSVFYLMFTVYIMKRLLSIILTLVMLCTCFVTVGASNPAVSISSSKTAVDKGDTVTISVKLASGSNLNGIKFKVEYNPTDFEYVAGSVSATNMFLVEPNDRNKGYIIYSGVSMSPVTAGGTLMTFKLRVLNYGGKISITVIEALDENDEATTVKATSTTLKCAHSKMNWKVSEKATCTKKGVEKGTCPCGYTATRETPMLEHTVGKYTVTKEPTCTEKGTKQAVCTICNKEFTEEIKATGHTYGKWVVEKEATETEKGLKKAECSVCGDVKEQAIPVISKETESTTFKENVTDEPTTEEETTKAPEKQEPVENKKELSLVTIVITTIIVTLGIEAIIGAIIFFALKNKKNKK